MKKLSQTQTIETPSTERTNENPEIKPVDRFCIELQDSIIDSIDCFNFRSSVASEWRENYNSKHGSKWGHTFDRLLEEAQMREYIKVIGNDWEYELDENGNEIRTQGDEQGVSGHRINKFLDHEIDRCFTIKWFKRRDQIDKWHKRQGPEKVPDPRTQAGNQIKTCPKTELNIVAKGAIDDYLNSHRTAQKIGIKMFVRNMLVYRPLDLEPEIYEAIVNITLNREIKKDPIAEVEEPMNK